MLLGRRVGDEDVDDSERQHRADFLVRQTGSKELLLSDLKFGQKIMKDMRGAAKAQWIRLRLPSCRPEFESLVHNIRFFKK